MKWDESEVGEEGTTVRRAYFQDHRKAHVLEDVGGRYMTLKLVGHEEIIASARRSSGHWWSVTLPSDPARVSFRLFNGKDAAIDAMLDRHQAEKVEADVRQLSGRVEVELDESSITVWHKDVKGSYDTSIDLTLEAEDNLLEVLLDRRNARIRAVMAS